MARDDANQQAAAGHSQTSPFGANQAPSAGDDLACPACGHDLGAGESFAAFGVCDRCRRHFPLPARERLRLLVDDGSFVESNAALVSLDPLLFRDLLPVPDRLADARVRAADGAGGLGEAVVTGVGAIEGREAALVVLDHAYLGGQIGLVAGEKVALAMELAANRRLPLILLCAAGGARTSAGLLALAQLPKLAAAAARLHRAGVPVVAVLAHATTGGVYAGLANQADVVLAEPGAQIGLGGRAGRGIAAAGAETNPAEAVLAHGLLDGVVDRVRLRPTLATLLGLFADRGAFRPDSPPSMAGGGVGSPAPPPAAPEVEAARHPPRPAPTHYLRRVVGDLVELRGDRLSADDPALACGLGRLGGVPVAALACGPGRIGAAGYRKATRVMRLAGHLELPLVLLIDTPGAAFGAAAEADGIGVAVGHLLGLTSFLPVPVVTAITGEAGGIGGIALAAGDRMLMLEHAVYRVADGEGESPAGGLPFEQRGGAGGEPGAAPSTLSTLSARECRRLGLVDLVVPEPEPAAHANPDAAARALGLALAGALAELAGVGPRRLLDDRARRLRGLGQATPEGREAARREVREFQDVQRALARSLGDLRERWEGRWVGRHPVRELRARLHLAAIARREGAAVREPGTGPAESAPLLGRQRSDLADLAGRFAGRRPSPSRPGGDDRDGTKDRV